MSLRKLIREIEDAGFVFKRQRGTHRIYKGPCGTTLCVPMKDGDRIGTGLSLKIKKKVGLK